MSFCDLSRYTLNLAHKYISQYTKLLALTSFTNTINSVSYAVVYKPSWFMMYNSLFCPIRASHPFLLIIIVIVCLVCLLFSANAYGAPIEDTNYTEHESVKRTCNTSGTPISSAFWTKVGSNRRWEGKTLKFSSITMRDEGQYRWGAISEECNNGNQTTFISVHYKASYTVALCYQFFLRSMRVIASLQMLTNK